MVQKKEYFWGVVNISNILSIPVIPDILFWVNSRCWIQAYVARIIESTSLGLAPPFSPLQIIILKLVSCKIAIFDLVSVAKPYLIAKPDDCSRVFKTFSCSTQLSMKCILLLNVKMPTIVGILTFINRINTTSESFKAWTLFIFQLLVFNEQLKKFHAQLS